ncbi:MAG: RNA polymerase factor sigma-54 [Desulfobulbaceae bacterium]|nr:RNA polymerase factor sigma-54 [Desulfobulbaceae bacterium]HIJ79772.1 RNA polymerase factor sigma-54 [Deltaproteobacteria bacterium]
MALELRQQLKLSQQLVMTPQLQQAIKLLQLSRLELAETLQQEIEINPVLEEALDGSDSADNSLDSVASNELEPLTRESELTSEVQMESTSSLSEIDWSNYSNEYEGSFSPQPKDDADLPSRLDIMSTKPNLQSHLQWQLNLSHLSDQEKEIGQFIIGNLDKNGFLEISEEDIVADTNCSPAMAVKMIKAIQEMDPSGVGARNVKESLLLQLDRLGLADSLATIMVRDHLHHLENKNFAAMAKACGKRLEEIIAAVKIIMGLDPHPGRAYSDEEPHYIIPDVYVHKISGEYVIMLNDEGLPRLKVSNYYKDILKKDSNAPAATKDYVQEKLKSAVWLIKSIQQRQRTIYRVVESILKFQYDFFEKGIAFLKPLVLRDVAEDISMHESTISRVTSNKYVHTPQGTFELKYFFNSTISRQGGDDMASESIKARIRTIIQNENHEKPLSDNAIAEIFKKENIQLARRTVAKYREQLGILPSKLRKKPNMGP